MRRKKFWLIPWAGVGAAVLIGTAATQGALVISAPNITAAPGSSGSFDVVLTDTDPTGSSDYQTVGDSFILFVDTGVQFTGADFGTSVSYIFAKSFDVDFGFSLSGAGISFPRSLVVGQDSTDYPVLFTTIEPGQTLGLGHVSFAVDADALPGSRALALLDVGAATVLFDNQGKMIPVQAIDGSITIEVPEPVSTGLMLVMGSMLAGRRRMK